MVLTLGHNTPVASWKEVKEVERGLEWDGLHG